MTNVTRKTILMSKRSKVKITRPEKFRQEIRMILSSSNMYSNIAHTEGFAQLKGQRSKVSVTSSSDCDKSLIRATLDCMCCAL